MADIRVSREGAAVVERTGFRLSWGGIFAGFVVATVLQFVLSLLGVAIGFAAFTPGADALRDFGIGAGIWAALTAIVSLFVGGMTAGRLAGVLTPKDGALHGVLMWSLSTLLAIWLLASGLGTVLGGAFGIVGRTLTATAGGLATGVGQAGGALAQQAGGLDLATIQREVEATLAATGRPELQPEALGAEADRIGDRTTAGAATNEQIARDIQATIQQRAGAVDRQAVVNVLAARTDMSQPEAEQVATRLEVAAQDARTRIGTAADTLGQRATRVADDATDVVSRGAWWALLIMGLSLGAATWGASMTARE
jgi:ElaB/YqjD/DUF883 family membrane-anchored ribosome-binding protein